MSADTIHDPLDAAPSLSANSAESDKLEVASAAAASRAAPKVRTKRPRPTFEDGSLTRVFKFPSKTYPKSSYYVTGDEIIIRIRKARKKWKLVIPKKRIRTYRTNRWFAKPRWIELELTYTQAVRLRLVELRPAAPVIGQDATAPVAVQTAMQPGEVGTDVDTQSGAVSSEAAHASLENAYEAGESIEPAEPSLDAASEFAEVGAEPRDTDCTAAEVEAARADDTALDDGDGEYLDDADDTGDDDGVHADEDTEPDDFDEVDEQYEFNEAALEHQAASVQTSSIDAAGEAVDALDAGNVARQAYDEPMAQDPSHSIVLPVVFTAPLGEVVAAPPSLSIAPVADEVSVAPALVAVESAGRSRPRWRAGGAVLSLLLIALTGGGITWMAFNEAAGTQVATETRDTPACTSSSGAADCSADIVTGSIRLDEEPPLASPPVSPVLAEAVTPEPAAVSGPQESETPDANQVDMSKAGASKADASQTLVAPHTVDVPPSPQPEATTVVASHASVDLEPPQSMPEPAVSVPPAPVEMTSSEGCRRLATAAPNIEIQFAFASAQLEPSAVASLDAFATKLPSCPSARIIVEGHTDADGDTDRNQALSVRRAQAVWQHLINAGAPPDRVWVIGFGHSRPLVANLTSDDKRRNRRAVLIVDPPR